MIWDLTDKELTQSTPSKLKAIAMNINSRKTDILALCCIRLPSYLVRIAITIEEFFYPIWHGFPQRFGKENRTIQIY